MKTSGGKLHLWVRCLAIGLSILLVWIDVSVYASVGAPLVGTRNSQAKNGRAQGPSLHSNISIPSEFGTLDESFKGSSQKTILYIQDVHDSLEAQENISNLIDHFVK